MENQYDIDTETGERVPYRINAETGEVERLDVKGKTRIKNKFRIPQQFLKEDHHCRTFEKLSQKNRTKTEQIPTMALLFFLPTLFCFQPTIWLIISMVEWICHWYAHHRNKTCLDPNIYYESPLNIITRIVCAKCRREHQYKVLQKVKDLRHGRLKLYGWDYFNRIVT